MNDKNEMLLSVRGLTVEYTSNNRVIHAVNDVSFDLSRGETLGLVGETGAGKTTIAKAIMRILPDPPAKVKSGEVFFEGNDLLKCPSDEMRKIRGDHISMIFQDPMTALNPNMRIGDQIAEVFRWHTNLSKQERYEKAVEILKLVGISEDRYREYPHQFSGGMKQRVIIAMALACDPDLILADEPTTALDVTIQAQILAMIDKLKEQKNAAMVLITHDLGVVAGKCDKVAVVYAGQIVEYGTLEEIYDHTAHPYTIGLFQALPEMNSGEERLAPIRGLPPDPAALPDGCKFHPRCPYATGECRCGEIETVNLSGTHTCLCRRAGDDVISNRRER